MTLIACIDPDNNPTFIADRIISSELGRPHLSLPSIGSRSDRIVSRSKTRLHGTMVKLVRATDSILVLFAGEISAAHSILNGVKEVFDGIQAPLAFVRAYVEANFQKELERVSLIVHIHDEHGGDTWWKRCVDIQVPHVGRILLAGTGIERALHYLQDMSGLDAIPPTRDYSRSTFCALALTGALLGDEMRTGEPPQKGFGGYYDIVSSNQSVVKDISNVTNLFWFGRKESDGSMNCNFPSKVLRSFKWPLGCGVHAVELPSLPYVAHYKWEIFLETTSGVTSTAKLPSFPAIPDLNADWQVNCAMFDEPDGISSTLSVSYNKDRKGHMVRFQRRRHAMHIKIDTEKLKFWLRPDAEWNHP